MEKIIQIKPNKLVKDLIKLVGPEHIDDIKQILEEHTNAIKNEDIPIDIKKPCEPAHNLLIQLEKIGKQEEDVDNNFKNSKHKLIAMLKPNNKGKIAERFTSEICEICRIEYTYKGTKNKNSKDGTYDIIINNKKCEIKLACQGKGKGKNGSFQHETLRNEGCDYYIFISILPDYAYFTILPKWDLKTKCPYMSCENASLKEYNEAELNKMKNKELQAICKELGLTKGGKKAELVAKILHPQEKDFKKNGVGCHLRKGATNVYKFTFTEKHIKEALTKGFSIKIDDNVSIGDIGSFINKIIK